MNDIEMVELAAKTIHAKVWEPAFKGDHRKFTAEGFSGWFDPLNSDAHAFTLACHLFMSVSTGPCQATACTIEGALRGCFPKHDTIHTDKKRAVRWVIVRAAADVGEHMA